MEYCKILRKEVNGIDPSCNGWKKPFRDFSEPELCKSCQYYSADIIAEYLDKENDESGGTLTIADIRNNLSPITNLIALLKLESESDEDLGENSPMEMQKDRWFMIQDQLPQCKKSINYLAQREVYGEKEEEQE